MRTTYTVQPRLQLEEWATSYQYKCGMDQLIRDLHYTYSRWLLTSSQLGLDVTSFAEPIDLELGTCSKLEHQLENSLSLLLIPKLERVPFFNAELLIFNSVGYESRLL